MAYSKYKAKRGIPFADTGRERRYRTGGSGAGNARKLQFRTRGEKMRWKRNILNFIRFCQSNTY